MVLALFAAFLFAYASPVSEFLWKKWHISAIWLNRNPKLDFEIGNFYFNGGAYDLDKAERAFAAAVTLDPTMLWGHYQLSRVYFAKGELDKALAEINKELDLFPETLQSLYVRGLIYANSGRTEEAIKDFTLFTKWAPKEWAGYNDLAWVLTRAGKYTLAKETIEKAFKEIPDANRNPWLWNGLGLAELNLNKYENAEIAFKKAEVLSNTLTPNDWVRAYPSSDSKNADSDIIAFRVAISKNLEKSKKLND